MRPTPPRQHNAKVPKDLETICLKCLQKDPLKRYASAEKLADELERFLHDEPITARPVSRTERAVKWVKRNTALAIALAAMVLVLVLGAGISTWQAVEAYTQKQMAEAEAKRANDNEQIAKSETERAKSAENTAKHQATRAKIAEGQAKSEAARAKAAEGLANSETERAKLAEAKAKAAERQAKLDAQRAKTAEQKAKAAEQLAKQEADRANRNKEEALKQLDFAQHTLYLSNLQRVTEHYRRDPHKALEFLHDYRFAPISRRCTAWRFYERQCSKWHKGSILGPKSTIYSLRYSPSGRIFALSGSRTGIQLWDAKTKTLIATLGERTGSFFSLSFSRYGKLLASTGPDKTIKIWNVPSRTLKISIPGGGGTVSLSPDGNLVAASSGWPLTNSRKRGPEDIRLWNVHTGKVIGVLKGHTGEVRFVCFSPDGKMLASSGDGGVKIWDVKTATLKRTLDKGGFLSFSPDGKTLASASEGQDHLHRSYGSIALWDLATGKRKAFLKGHTSFIQCVRFSPNGQFLASGSRDGTVNLWHVQTGQIVVIFRGHSCQSNSLSFAPDGGTLVSTSGRPEANDIRFWNVATRQENAILTGGSKVVSAVSFSSDGRTLASAQPTTNSLADFSRVLLWDVATGKIQGRLRGEHTARVNSVSFSPDGKLLASGSVDNTIRLWNLKTKKVKRTLKGHSGGVHSVRFSPDGKTLASGSGDKTIKLWNVETGQIKATLKGHSRNVCCVTFRPDGYMLASAGWDATIRLWDMKSREVKTTLKPHSGIITDVCFSPDGQILASVTSREIQLWDVQTGQVKVSHKNNDQIRTVTFSPDGKTFLTGGGRANSVIKLWDVRTGKQLATFERRADFDYALCFSPDGRTLASAGSSGDVRLWDVGPGKVKADFRGQSEPVFSVCFSPDGKTFASAGEKHTSKENQENSNCETQRPAKSKPYSKAIELPSIV